MLSPTKALKILVQDKFKPLKREIKKLVLKNFDDLKQLALSPGSEVELEGYITYVSKTRGDDLDVHFNLAQNSNDRKNYVVCEIQNEDENEHRIPLNEAWKHNQKVRVTGVLRIFLEHIYQTAKQPNLPHIFELHPVRSVTIDGKAVTDITMDCPAHKNFRANKSMHKIQLQNDGTMRGGKINDKTRAVYDGKNLSFINTPFLNTNYVYMLAHFSKLQDGSFPNGKPYLFQLKNSLSASSDGIESVVIPGTPAYDIARKFHGNPPRGKLTVAALRSLNIPELMQNNYHIMFCPVYRFG